MARIIWWAELDLLLGKSGRGRHARLVKQNVEKQVEQSSDNRCVLWRIACVLVFESSFKWRTSLFLMLFCSISAHFSKIQLVYSDGQTDQRTDKPSYRDARTHLINDLKRPKSCIHNQQISATFCCFSQLQLHSVFSFHLYSHNLLTPSIKA